jgi:hypothetical protein
MIVFLKNQVRQGKGPGELATLVCLDGASFVMAKTGMECIDDVKGGVISSW